MHTLEQLHSGALAGAREVRLTRQGLRTFPEALFTLADSLEVLDLSGNQLTTLPTDLHRLQRLRVLFASDNPFTTLPQALSNCAALEMVGFKACRIHHVPADSLPPRLRWLILTDNCIAELPTTLGHCTRLQKLMLSCNRLSTLPASLAACSHLELVRLACNRFTQVPRVLAHLPRLAWVALASNPMTQKAELQAKAAPWLEHIFYQNITHHELLGSGASGDIYRATHDRWGPVALKVFKAQATSDGSPHSEYAAGCAAGQHPHLLTPLAAVQGGPSLATALPLLPPRMQPLALPPSLHSCTRDVYIPQTRPPTADALQRLRGAISQAIEHLHGRSILHGDLYGHNILWDPDSGHAVVSDFGAATLLHGLPHQDVEMLLSTEARAWHILCTEIDALVSGAPEPDPISTTV